MDPYDTRMRQMTAIDALGGALACDRAILRLDKSTGSMKMEFLSGADADVLNPEVTALVDIAAAVRKD